MPITWPRRREEVTCSLGRGDLARRRGGDQNPRSRLDLYGMSTSDVRQGGLTGRIEGGKDRTRNIASQLRKRVTKILGGKKKGWGEKR